MTLRMLKRIARAALLAGVAVMSAPGDAFGQTPSPLVPPPPAPVSSPDMPPPAPPAAHNLPGPAPAPAPLFPPAPGAAAAPGAAPAATRPRLLGRRRAAQEPEQKGRLLGRLRARFLGNGQQSAGR